MCNNYASQVNYRAYVEGLLQAGIPLLAPTEDQAPNLEPLDDIRPTDTAPILRAVDGGAELVQMRWGLAPSQPKRPPVINMQSEGRKFTKGRCLIPASAYFEFTGTTYPKTRWSFTRVGEDWFCIAGVIGRAVNNAGEEVDAFTLLTGEPGADVKKYHDREPIVLDPGAWPAWLNSSVPAAQVLRTSLPGALQVVEAPREPKPKSPAALR